MIAVALLVLPWALVWVLARHHHLGATAVTILVSVTIPLATLWLTWAALRTTGRPAPTNSAARPGIINAGPGSVVADREGTAIGPGSVVASPGGTAIGQVVYQQRRGVTGKPVRLADPPPLLAGREDLLAELHTRLTDGDNLTPRKVALYGLGGVGKTSVALAYAHRHLTEVGVAWQFTAEDSTVLRAGFAELAAQLDARDLADPRDPVLSVHAVLATFPAPWLLIFDSAADKDSVAAFLPPAGPGQVLITSQNAIWPDQPLNVPMLAPDVAADFLTNRTGDQDRQTAQDLADLLGGLPLALEQAAAYVHAAGDTLARYLALFRRRRAEMLARGDPAGYDKTLATTWALAFDRLQHTEPGAAGLLRLLAFCAPEAVPLRLLLQPRPGLAGQLGDDVAPLLVPLLDDPLAAGDTIAALRRYSLVTPAADGAVSVHRLVQAVTQDEMPIEQAREWKQAAAALIDTAIPSDTGMPETWAVCAAMLPHAQLALDLTTGGIWRIALYLGLSGNYPAARDLFQRIADAHWEDDAYGEEHPDTLNARSYLARWTGQAGAPAAARDQYAALLDMREKLLGPEHPDTLTTRGNLASWTGHAGDAAAARDQLAALLSFHERVRGPEHMETLTTRASLATWTGLAGNPVAARDQLTALLPVHERVRGHEHPDALAVRSEFACWTGEAGDAATARDQLAEVLAVEERMYGPEHPDTLTTRANFARWTGKAGDPAAARDQYAELLRVNERIRGPEHPETLTDRGNLADWTGYAGNAAAARDQNAALLPMRERVSGSEHPATLAVRGNLAYWTGKAGNSAAARDLFAKVLAMYERVRGPEHLLTRSIRRELAHWTERAEQDADKT